MWFLNTAPDDFGFGAMFYDASVRKSCKTLVLYSDTTHQAGVYEAHGVWCANVLCAPVLDSSRALIKVKNVVFWP